MRTKLLALVLLATAGILSGCVIETPGGYHHHGYYDR